MKKILLIVSSLFALSFLTISLAPQTASAQFKEEACQGLTTINSQAGCGANANKSLSSLLQKGINIFSIIVGFIAIVSLIIAGLKFITSGGDPAKVSSARSAIIYSLIGLAVVVLAQAIVRFVLVKVR